LDPTKNIKDRLNRLRNTRKVTKAMEMIASSKIRTDQRRILEARPFIRKLEDFISDITRFSSVPVPLINRNDDIKSVLVIGVTADRGLCGGYNSEIIRLIEKTIKEIEGKGKKVKLDMIGAKGKNYFKYAGIEMNRVFENLSDHPKFLDARGIANDVIESYINKEVGQVIICYTKFKNAAEQVASVRQILPILFEEDEGVKAERISENLIQVGDRFSKVKPEFIYEPSPEEILKSLLPEYIYTIIYMALLESTASETGARMTAMRNSSDNADDIIKDLTQRYYRVRQQQITIEISEIVSGAEALKQAGS
jgi:F-type H+-transporting ATPase subunit gamma